MTRASANGVDRRLDAVLQQKLQNGGHIEHTCSNNI